MAIRKSIIQAWIGPTPIPKREKEWCDQMRRMNPDFEYHFFGNEVLDRYGSDRFVKYMISRGEKWAFVMDRIRLLLLRDHEGGIWIDPDAKPVRPLSRLKWWNAPHVDFVTAHRDPYRSGVSLHRGIALADNTVMGTAPNGRILGHLLALYNSSNPVQRGGQFGREIMARSGWDTVWESPLEFYSLEDCPEAVILHDGHNLASWNEHRPLQFAEQNATLR